MAGYSSHDAYINGTTVDGKFWRSDFNKLTHAVGAHIAGEWACLFHSLGNPTAGVLNGGTNLSFQSLCERSTGAIPHNGTVGTNDFKTVLNASAFSAAATTMPAVFMLVDLLGYYPMSTVTTTGNQATIHAVTVTANAGTDLLTHTGYDIPSFTRVQFTTTTTLPAGLALATDYWTIRQSATTSTVAASLANAIAGTPIVDITDTGTGTHTITTMIPRYTTGAGVMAFATPTTIMGAGTPNMLINYTDSDGNTGNTTPTTLPIGKTACNIGTIAYSGTGAGKYGPFFPLAAGDRGIRSIQQLNLSATYTSGAMAWVLAKPLLTLPMTTIGVAAERNMMNDTPSLPRVYDGACLAWLMYAGAATPVNSSFFGHIDFGWT